MTLPYFAVGAVFSLAAFVLNEYVVPDANDWSDQILTRQTYLRVTGIVSRIVGDGIPVAAIYTLPVPLRGRVGPGGGERLAVCADRRRKVG
jgi:hypothetical protein